MKTATKILLVVVGLLLLVDICFHILARNSNVTFAKQFKLETFHTNNVSVIGIDDAKTGKPLLMNWNYGDGLNPGELSFFSEGINVLNVYFRTNKPPAYRFIFHGPVKSETWWFDRQGIGSFDERIFYDTNADFSKHEIWYQDTWQTVDRRNEKNGIVLNGQWYQLAFDANHNWTINTNR